MNILYRLSAFWYTRVVLFLLLVAGASYAALRLHLFPAGMGQEGAYALVLLVSLAVEAVRKDGSYVLLGFPARWMLRHTLWGLGLSLLSIVAIGTAAALLGAQWHAAESTVDFGIIARDLAVFAILAGGEEVLFRGVVFQALYERFGSALTVVLTSLAFAAAHLFNPSVTTIAIVNIFLAGVLFSLMYVHTRALWLPWAFHFGWNAAQHYLLGSPVSGFNMGAPVLEVVAPDSTLYRILLGGWFGIEGGLVASVVLVAGIAVVSLPKVAQVAPELAARLFRRQYAESMFRYSIRVPWGRAADTTANTAANAE